MNDTPGLVIRDADEKDAALLLALIRELAEYEKLSHEVVATEASLRAHLFNSSPVARALIASLDGQPVGYALFFPNFSTFSGRPGIYLEDLFVRLAARGRGVGRSLIQAVARIAMQRDAGHLEWAVLNWNDPAIGFYRKLGAAPMDQWTLFRASEKVLTLLGSD